MNPNLLTNLKLAELASTLGVGFLGFGLGIYFYQIYEWNAYVILVIGIILHAAGMYYKHSIETQTSPEGFKTDTPVWFKMVYWLCWISIAIFLIYLWTKKNI